MALIQRMIRGSFAILMIDLMLCQQAIAKQTTEGDCQQRWPDQVTGQKQTDTPLSGPTSSKVCPIMTKEPDPTELEYRINLCPFVYAPG